MTCFAADVITFPMKSRPGLHKDPVFLGILNLTEDSFSDGGRFLAPQTAIEHGTKLMRDGAQALDIGAQPSNPDSRKIDPEVEIARLQPVLEYFAQKGVPVSVDTYEPSVQSFAIRNGAAFINDIHGFPHTEMYPELAASSAKLIVMHSIQKTGHATRIDSRPEEVYDGMLRFFAARIEDLTRASVEKERLILDPGMGFFLGSNPESSLFALKRTADLKREFGLPLLVSVSRKSFLGHITGRDIAERGPATLAAELFALEQGADLIRTHDPGALRDAWLVRKKLEKE